MSDLIGYLGSFNNNVLIPFILGFFQSNIGFIFVACAVLLFVISAVVRLMKLKF